MSTFISNNNRLIFGSDSPIGNSFIKTEPNLKNTLMNLIMDKSSKIYRQRAWKIFRLANNIFPDRVARVNDSFRHAIGELVNPFITPNLQTIDELIYRSPRQKYVQGEIYLTNELHKLTGVKASLAMVVDSEKEFSAGTRHGVITYITRGVSLGECSDLDPDWKDGFFKFNNPNNLCLMVLFPKQYLATVIQNVLSTNTRELNSKNIDRIAIKGAVIDEITIDVIKSIFSAAFTDGIRTKCTSDILLTNNLLQKEGMNITVASKSENDAYNSADVFAKYTDLLKQFKHASGDEHIIYEIMKFTNYYNRDISINPLEFYSSFIDTPYAHVEDMICKCSSFQKLQNQAFKFVDFNYSNSLKEMDMFQADRDRDILIYGTKLIRFLPWLLFDVYILGGGANHQNVKSIIKFVDSAKQNISLYKASNVWTAPVVEFLVNNINYIITTLYSQISSPLTVTVFSRKALIGAIDRFGELVEESGIDGITRFKGETEAWNNSPAFVLSEKIKMDTNI